MTAPTREEFAERLLKGSVKKSYAPVVDIDWDAPLDPDKFFLPPKTVSLYGTPMWDEMPREQQIDLSRAGARQHPLRGHLVREHPQPGAAAQDDAPGSHRQSHALRADRTRRRDAPHGDVRQGDRSGRRQAGAAAVLPAVHHQPAAVRVPGPGAVGGGADRRRDLRLAAAADDGRRRTAADGAAPHADSRHRGSTPHPVRPRRSAQADTNHAVGSPSSSCANINGLGGYFFRFLFTNKVPYRRVGLDARQARRVARSSPHRRETQVLGFAPLAAFLEEVGLMGPIARRMWRRTGFLPQ